VAQSVTIFNILVAGRQENRGSIPCRVRVFFHCRVYADSSGHPDFYPVSIRDSFAGSKAEGA
jgi:hypothetical protein